MKRKIEPYASLGLKEQLFRESRAMAEYALANGLEVKGAWIRTIEDFGPQAIEKEPGEIDPGDDNSGAADQKPSEDAPDVDPIDAIVHVHKQLSERIHPATPRTILLLDIEQEVSSFWKFIGPVSLIRQMMIAAMISLGLFVGLAITEYVDLETRNIFSSSGLHLLANLGFYLSAAGLGASFSALYKANFYITKGTFDPTHHASYWIRFFLGLIAGLVLAVVIAEEALQQTEKSGIFIEGILRPLLAMLGGFSADLFHTFLSRMVESFKMLFQGSSTARIDSEVQEKKSKLETEARQKEMKMAANIMKVQQRVNSDADPEEIKAALNAVMADIAPELDSGKG